MADKLVIEVFKTKNIEDFTKSISSADCRAQSGSAAAATASIAGALFVRAAARFSENSDNTGRVDYIRRNAEILRTYMVHLIDEDVKCRAPLRKALKEGDSRAVEAAYHTACEINSEIINMMNIALELMREGVAYCDLDSAHLLKQAATLALSTVDVCIEEILHICSKCTEESFIYVSRRENEITRNLCFENYTAIMQ